MRTHFFAALIFVALAAPAHAAKPQFVEGDDYKEVRTPIEVPNPRKIEVVEYFWYGCPHCYQFESNIEPWLAKKPDIVTFKRIPHTMGRPVGEMHALAYEMAEKLGITSLIHAEMFKAIHEHKKNMDTLADICEVFLKSGGIQEDPCRAAAEDADVKQALQNNENLIRRFGIVNVPTLVVDGRYYSNAVMAGGKGKLIDVLDFLIAKQKTERHIRNELPPDYPSLHTGPRNRPGAPPPF